MHDFFRKFACYVSEAAGTPWAFILCLTAIITWAVTGPVFHFSDTWQLVINTGTTIVTFLMVFLIQRTQNKDALAIHLKLNEIVAALARGDRVELRGFGAFSVKNRPARTGRNPRTGESVTVEEKWVPFFKTGKELRERLNGKV